MNFTDDEIVAEMIRRRQAQDSLPAFAKSITIPGAPPTDITLGVPEDEEGAVARILEQDDPDYYYQPIESGLAAHHLLTMQEIERCIREPSGRLMIFQPPGSAKSTYASVVGPTWAMGRFPGLQVLMAGYAGVPIIRHSKRARQIVASPAYANIWDEPVTLVRGSRSAEDWELTNGSRCYAAGLQGAITSTRCDLGIIDDPVAGRQEADSETERRNTKQAYEDDFLTRLKPGGSVILIQTRWHEDDLAGGILPDGYKGESGDILCRDGQIWRVLCLPMMATRTDDPLGRAIGEPLWPEWFTERHRKTYQGNPRTWSALFQQDPQPSTGGQFDKETFHRFTRRDLPKTLVRFGTGDWAVTKKQLENHPDWTVLGCWGMDEVGDLWLYDGYRKQESVDVTTEEWSRLTKVHHLTDWAMEGGVIRRAIEPGLNKEQERKKAWTSILWLPAVADKIANANSFRGMANARKVHILAGPFGDYVIQELCAFPFARYDDAVDMCGLAGRFVDQYQNPEKPKKRKDKKAPKFGTMEYLEYEDEDERRQREDYMR